MKKLLCLIILLFSFCMPVWATTYYVEPGGSGVSTSQGSPGGLYDSWNDMCAGITISDGDTICLLDGTYDDTTHDVPVTGLGECTQNISLTFRSESGNPKDCVIDFSNTNFGVSGLRIFSFGTTWTIEGLTLHSAYHIIHRKNGTLKIYNCIVHDFAGRGIYQHSDTVAAATYAYNCEFYTGRRPAISAFGTGGDTADRIMEAHYCYFHDIRDVFDSQGMAMHQGGTARAYFCKFKNIGSPATGTMTFGGAIINGSSIADNNIYAYNCIIEDCYVGFCATGELIAKGCHFNNVTADGVVAAVGMETAAATIEDCIFTNIGGRPINANRIGDLTVRRCCIEHTAGGYIILGALEGDNAITLIMEDNIIYYPGTDDKYVVRFAGQELNIKRNLIWLNADAPSNLGIFSTGNTAQTGGVINFEHNCIRKAGTDQLFYVVANPTTYNGGYNNWTTGSPLSAGNRMGAIKDTDQWCAAHPDSDLCTSCFCELPEALNCNSKSRAFWSLMSKLTGWDEITCPNLSDSTIVNFDDFSVLADNWLGDSSKPGDFDGDGIVNVNDLVILSAYWLLDCNID